MRVASVGTLSSLISFAPASSTPSSETTARNVRENLKSPHERYGTWLITITS